MLRLWEGLGYYRRARQLHQAARLIVDAMAAGFPATSTSFAACRALAATRPEPSFPSPSTGRRRSSKRTRSDCSAACWPIAASPIRRRASGSAGRWPRRSCRGEGPDNSIQALMELGSEVCRLRAPRCDACPVAPLCRAFISRTGTDPSSEAKAGKHSGSRNGGGCSPRRAGALDAASRRRAMGRTLGFPSLCDRRPQQLCRGTSSRVGRWRPRVDRRDGAAGAALTTFKHGVTRFRITLDCYEAEYISRDGGPADSCLASLAAARRVGRLSPLHDRPKTGKAHWGEKGGRWGAAASCWSPSNSSAPPSVRPGAAPRQNVRWRHCRLVQQCRWGNANGPRPTRFPHSVILPRTALLSQPAVAHVRRKRPLFVARFLRLPSP